MSAASAYQGRSLRSTGAGPKSAGARAVKGPKRSPGTQIRWDRLGGLALVFVGAALLYLYLSAGIHMFSTWRQARHDSAVVSVLEREHGKLEGQRQALRWRGTLEEEARQLGMMNKGEQSYIVSGLPNN
jgi:hypothetical protein